MGALGERSPICQLRSEQVSTNEAESAHQARSYRRRSSEWILIFFVVYFSRVHTIAVRINLPTYILQSPKIHTYNLMGLEPESSVPGGDMMTTKPCRRGIQTQSLALIRI
jgi:hypothetical protein